MCWTFAHVSTCNKKAGGLMQHRGPLESGQAGDWPRAASGLHHSPVPGPAASFTFNQINNHHAMPTVCLSKPGLGDAYRESKVKLPMQALLHNCCCFSLPDLPPCTASDWQGTHETRVLAPPHLAPSLTHVPPSPSHPHFWHWAARRAALLQRWWGRGTPVCTVMPGDSRDGTLLLLQPDNSLVGHC